jgi:multicomponent Na+:H+ antiporter subunit G
MLYFIGYFLIFVGLFFVVSSVIGCFRFPDYFCKMHAATIGDAIGCPMILLGLAIQQASIKILLLALIVIFINPAASYALNRFKMNSEKYD